MEHKDVLLITQKVGLEEDVVVKQYEAFLEKYPAGEMTKEEFVAYCLEKDDTAEESMSEALFRIFDKDSSGSIDFFEYVMASRASKTQAPLKGWTWQRLLQDGHATTPSHLPPTEVLFLPHQHAHT